MSLRFKQKLWDDIKFALTTCLAIYVIISSRTYHSRSKDAHSRSTKSESKSGHNGHNGNDTISDTIESLDPFTKVMDTLKSSIKFSRTKKPITYYLGPNKTWTPHEYFNFKGFNLLPKMPNPYFIFHNKLPKSGSTSMSDLVNSLSGRNNFNYVKMNSGNMKFDAERILIEWLRVNLREPFFFMQHHYWMNFTKYGIDQPTMINVIREPVSWFSSHYHFKLNGWERLPGQRANSSNPMLSLEDCILKRAPDCTRNSWRYIEFFTGSAFERIERSSLKTDDLRQETLNLETEKQKADGVKQAKIRLIKDYHVIGVLEQFEDTLELLEHMLPRYYKGARATWKNSNISGTQNKTKSLHKKKLSDEAVEMMKLNVLHHETDLYDFTGGITKSEFFSNLKFLEQKPMIQDNSLICLSNLKVFCYFLLYFSVRCPR